MCNKEPERELNKKFEMVFANKCSYEMNFEGKEACSFSFDIWEYLRPLSKFFGLIEFAVGIVMCFFGSKFLQYCFSALIFMMVNGFVTGISYNLGFFQDPKTGEPVLTTIGGVVAVGAIVGGIVAYFSYKCADRFAAPLLAGWCGGALMTLVLTPMTSLQG